MTIAHKRRFDEIRKNLVTIGCKEAAFIKIELLFYEAMELSRSYGNNEAENKLLSSLKQLQLNEYAVANALYKKSSQREQAIRRFSSRLKAVLAVAVKDSSVLNGKDQSLIDV